MGRPGAIHHNELAVARAVVRFSTAARDGLGEEGIVVPWIGPIIDGDDAGDDLPPAWIIDDPASEKAEQKRPWLEAPCPDGRQPPPTDGPDPAPRGVVIIPL